MFIADFHIHSKYSRATSKECVPEYLDMWARRKGLNLIGTGDFTHPVYRQELREKLVPAGDGLYALRPELAQDAGVAGDAGGVRFMVTGEISSIYKKNGKVRKVHNLILLPGLEQADALAKRLEANFNLHSDGRPILGLDSRDLLEITLETYPQAIFIPAHIWTPHFSLFGAYSGFDDIHECFEDLTGHIHALETGLSSNPAMNWQLSALDGYTLVSNSDAHSPGNLAREANLFDTELSYPHIAAALENPEEGFRGTIEFFPEEGKYHFNGHRNCKVCQSPSETAAAGGVCPVCGRQVTLGVQHRVEELADREEGFTPPGCTPFESLVPLPEVLAASTGFSAASKKGKALYARLLREIGPELYILRKAPLESVEAMAGKAAAEGIRRLRSGEVEVSPGYDGAYGKVYILKPDEIEQMSGQMRFILDEELGKVTKSRKETEGKTMAKAVETRMELREPPQDGAVLQGLNEQQQEAVESAAPAVAVVAGPGTGKTKTLVARIAHLAGACKVPPAQIAALTFTNKAAGEMRERLQQHFGSKRMVNAMSVGTFHSICIGLLKKAGREVAVVSDAAARLLMENLVSELGLQLSPREALRRISLRKCGVPEPDDLPEGLYEAYQSRLKEYGVLDFDDILLEALELDLGKHAKQFQYLLVDEFQDMNPVQYRLLRKWAELGKSLFVIGDPNQSIYGFRGSDAHCFEWLRADYPELVVVKLKQNYRSTREILDCAAPVIKTGAPRLAARRGQGAKVRLVKADTAFSEAVFVAKEIGRMVGGMDMLDSGCTTDVRGFSDIAVLYRTNRQSALLEECLAKEGIPYVVTGRDEFLSGLETVRALAFFRLLLNPADMVSLQICLKQLADCPQGEADACMEDYGRGKKDVEALVGVLEKGAAASQSLAKLVEQYGPLVRKEKPQKLVASWTAGRAGEAGDWADKLAHMAALYDSMEHLIRALDLGQESDIQRFGGKKITSDAVSLMTLHGSKGLEFPAVFLCGVAKGLIPNAGQRGTSSEEEERRLFYVGMTRAKDELVLLHYGEESPFLADLPAALIEKSAAQARSAAAYRQVGLFDQMKK